MKKYFVFAALVLAAAVSCTRELATEEIVGPKKGYVQITLSANCDVDSKAVLDGKKVVWSVGEEVAVFPGGNGSAEKFTVSAVDGSSVTISGSVPEGSTTFVAAYPYKNAVSCSSNVVTMTIGDQTVSGTATVDPDALSSVAYFESVASKPTFYNTVSLVSFQVAQEGFTKVTFAPLTGSFGGTVQVTASASAAPEVAFPATPAATPAVGVAVSCAEGFAVGTTYYAAVAPGQFSGLNVTSVKDGKSAQKVSENGATIARGAILPLGDISPLGGWKFGVITNAQELKEFLADASNYTDSDVAELGNDIDCTEVEIVPAESYAGTFDGKGFTIKNLAATNALFAKLAATGVVKDVNIDATCAINWTEAISDMTGISFIVSSSAGLVKDCNVAGKITVKSGDAGRIYCAGVVGESEKGIVEGCKFTGSIDVELTNNSASCSAIAGVVARIGNKEMSGKTIVKDCENTGSIKFLFSGPSAGMKKFGIGGVVGQTPSVKNADRDHGIIENCINRGDIEWSYPAGGSDSYPALGGVVGIVEGQLKSAKNYGKVTYHGGTDVAATDASIGGVAGYVTLGASDCHNYGEIVVDGTLAGGTSMNQSGGNTSFTTIGGVFGNAGPYAADNTNCASKGVLVENCSNEASFTIKPYMVTTGGPQMCFGGVIGASTANVKNCQNKGKIVFESQIRTINAGGIVGFLEADMEDCTNSGSVTLKGASASHPAAITVQAYFGGVIGQVTKKSVIKNVKNTGDVTIEDMYSTGDPANSTYNILSYIGGIMGNYKGGITLNGAENSGAVTNKCNIPVVLGGIGGALNGSLSNLKNSGAVNNQTSYCSTIVGKEPEVGGIAGYSYGNYTNVESTGNITNAAAGGATGGIVGGYNSDKGNVSNWNACKVDCTISSAATAGAFLGRFRYNSASDDKYNFATINAGVDGGMEVAGGAASLPLVGNINGAHVFNCVNLVVNGVATVQFEEDLENNKFTYAGKEYPIIKLADNRYWMAAPLAYVPAGKKVSSNPVEDAGIWYTYTVVDGKAVPNTSRTDAYLYDYGTAIGKSHSDLTFGTQANWESGNYRDFEGTQGICPPGWYIPTYSDFLNLVGNGPKDETRGIDTAPNDNTALYYVAEFEGSSVPRFNEAGWNFSFLASRNKASNTQTGSYNVAALIDATKCTNPDWYGKPGLNQVMSSTAYKPNVAGSSFTYFVLMSTFSTKYIDGRLNISQAQYLQGVEVRCIRKAD